MGNRNYKHTSGPVGLADIELLLREFPSGDRKVIGGLVGYDYFPERVFQGGGVSGGQQNDLIQQKEASGGESNEFPESTEKPLKPNFWFVESRKRLDKDRPPSSDGIDFGNGELPKLKSSPPPPFSPISSWAKLWPIIKKALHGRKKSRQPDVVKAVRMLARGAFLQEIPLKESNVWAPFSQILVDVHLRLFPFWTDFHMVVNGVSDLVSKSGLEKHFIRFGPLEDAINHERMEYYPLQIDPYGAPLLILSDLGVYGSDSDREDWCEFGRMLHEQGINPVVLTPVPERLWDDRHKHLYKMICWDDSMSCATDGLSKSGLLPTAESVLKLCSSALRIEPGLLRKVRRILPGADVGVEGLVWNHPDVIRTSLSCSIRPEKIVAYQDSLCRIQKDAGQLGNDSLLLMKALFDKSFQVIQDYHTELPVEVRLEEQLVQHSLKLCFSNAGNGIGEDLSVLPEELVHYLGWLKEGAISFEDTDHESVQNWIRRMGMRQNRSVLNVYGAGYLKSAVANAFKDQPKDQPLPKIIVEDDVKKARGEDPVPPRFWEALQYGEQLVFRMKTSHTSAVRGETPLFSFSAQEKLTLFTGEKEDNFELKEGLLYPLEKLSKVVVSSSKEEFVLSLEPKPDWAESIYRDFTGLYATLPLNDSKIQYELPTEIDLMKGYYSSIEKDDQNDEPFKLSASQLSGSDSLSGGRSQNGSSLLSKIIRKHSGDNYEEGFWLNRSQLEQILESGVPYVSWAETYGFDQYGLYAELNILGITQRMRWIQPGIFLMGSPEDEPDRDNDEKLHAVTLTKGYWLADTACTQELWEKVMGNNLSYFKGDARLPVKSVSWGACQEFLQTANKELKGLNLQFPTEAQWEYACRAGTETPFSFGDNINTDQVNYNGNHPYKDAVKGEYRKHTVAVNEQPCNQWGLYQMHGNVWEWCADWYGKYQQESINDPQGPANGELRVMRGGSWVSYGRHVRSAARYGYNPDVRYDDFGFRFSLGQKG
ncbi:formylglycine-generating enzyme family protein [Desulfovibrio sp. UCD-KL4C]|uniref:formylglycine-generating enzyme family protein n=1 Tax=Desulfovibrio sp. UCD-KL4C TaxID=2578120 RepID=UPI0025C59B0F|nr:formylglycine-generating enzyme family protein [Desulfovibrio sp. UCD-KL4C]